MATVSGNEVEKTDEGYAGVIHLIDDKFFFSILSPFFSFFLPLRVLISRRERSLVREIVPPRVGLYSSEAWADRGGRRELVDGGIVETGAKWRG